jgi:hypothetical protein
MGMVFVGELVIEVTLSGAVVVDVSADVLGGLVVGGVLDGSPVKRVQVGQPQGVSGSYFIS